MKFVRHFIFFTIITLTTLVTFAQHPHTDSLQIWQRELSKLDRRIDSFRILAAGNQEDQSLLHNQLRPINDSMNRRAAGLLADRAIAGNVLTGRSHDAQLDSLQEIQLRMGFAIQFLNERFDQYLIQIDSSLQQKNILSSKIEESHKKHTH